MRIAVFDDNIADRRHTERLLKRESDRIHGLGAESFVIDCYGNPDKLYSMADTYDIFLIDQAEVPEETGMDIARALRAQGVLNPVILMCGRIDYQALAEDNDTNFYYLNKPFEQEALTDMVSLCGEHLVKRVGAIELRGDVETLHVTSSEILYACEAERGYLTVALEGREPIRIMSDAPTLFELIMNTKKDPAIVAVSPKSFLNKNHIVKMGLFSARMRDGKKLTFSPSFLSNAAELRAELKKPAASDAGEASEP